ncbi:MAG TPA: M20/M25/M40 family metallo-hydrolase [Bryobacteraceae bacterium]|nr:M20/M25/M40 family metallo-hydrolase [Bryobacteraceae bacterium]
MTRLPVVLLFCVAVTRAGTDDLTEHYRSAADRLIDAALKDTEGYAKLTYLCDRIGNRISGSRSLEKAVAWSVEQMKRDGLANVQTLPVKVPHWIRGRESAKIVAPIERPIRMLGLGMSVGTPAEGITADVVVVSGIEQLAELSRERVQGKVVLFNAVYKGYGQTVVNRIAGASRAAALGAAAVLVRSITPLAVELPHTGALTYQEGVPRIPAAAVTIEDALLIERLSQSGSPVKVHLEMEAHQGPEAASENVVGEIPGRDLPEEVVVLGGHLDSWDVGQGAQDDGSGIMASLEAVALVKKLGLQPRRTIRVVFWVNEENGGKGGEAYRRWVGDRLSNHVAAIEMDGGAERPLGFGFGGFGGGRAAAVESPDAGSLALLKQVGKLLERIGAGEIGPGGGGSDIAPLTREGVPSLSPRTVGLHYFDWHHTEADTLDKVDLEDFRKNVAGLAVMSYVLADMPGRLVGSK